MRVSRGGQAQHAAQREHVILHALSGTGFVSLRTLLARLDASPATIRRDLLRLQACGKVRKVRGGATSPMWHNGKRGATGDGNTHPRGSGLSRQQAVGRAAAALCRDGEAIMICGDNATLHMCPFLAGRQCQVLTNSLRIVGALLRQDRTRVLIPSGSVLRGQHLIIGPAGQQAMPRFHAPRLFIGAVSLGPQGVMRTDTQVAAAERPFLDRAEHVIVLLDSTLPATPSGAIICSLSRIDVVVTDAMLPQATAALLEAQGVEVIIV